MNNSSRPYHIQIEKKVQKFLKKLDKKIRDCSVQAIENLGTRPIPKNKKHILATKGDAMLCELGVDKIRFYYEIKYGIIFIEEVEYLGRVRVLEGKRNHKSGNKSFPNQKKFILTLLSWFKKRL